MIIAVTTRISCHINSTIFFSWVPMCKDDAIYNGSKGYRGYPNRCLLQVYKLGLKAVPHIATANRHHLILKGPNNNLSGTLSGRLFEKVIRLSYQQILDTALRVHYQPLANLRNRSSK